MFNLKSSRAGNLSSDAKAINVSEFARSPDHNSNKWYDNESNFLKIKNMDKVHIK